MAVEFCLAHMQVKSQHPAQARAVRIRLAPRLRFQRFPFTELVQQTRNIVTRYHMKHSIEQFQPVGRLIFLQCRRRHLNRILLIFAGLGIKAQ